jgi:hypothetical protein
MSEILTKVNREKGFTYRVDKDGNLIKEPYNWFKDPSTLVMLVILILGGLYYFEMKQSATNADNFDLYCEMYTKLKSEWLAENPGQNISFRDLLEDINKMKYLPESKLPFNLSK